ncbi:MAG: hypothetical protein QNJ97_13755 [Myxococcota bacterium]|nr:hypothetical protein [Myxococcota bacterium]
MYRVLALGVWLQLSVVGLLACNGSGDDTSPDGGTDSEGESACPWDDDDTFSTANALTLGTAAQGYICPRADQDWYALSTAPGTDLLTVTLAIDAELVSPIGPTYSVWSADGANVLASPEGSETAAPAAPMTITHSLPSGSYFIAIKDRGDDAEDERHPYLLTAISATDADPFEPNNAMETAATVTGTSLVGSISFRGDQDWFRIDSIGREILHIQLTMPVAGIDPTYQVVDAAGNLLISDVNAAGSIQPTDLEYYQALEAAGTYYIVIADDDGLASNAEVNYTLGLTLIPDPDGNEPNDHPHAATPLPDLSCAEAWSDWAQAEGYLASSGDIDWYKINVANSARGIIELSAVFDTSQVLPADLQMSVRIVRGVDDKPCAVDQDCHQLTTTCEYDLDCHGIGNTCLAEGVCAGAGVCLPGGTCGGAILAEAASEKELGKVDLTAPLFGEPNIYIAIQDYQGDAFSLGHQYILRARVRTDADALEPSEAYTAGPAGPDDRPASHIVFAREIPVHNCVDGVDCCSADTWISGYLSYKYDQDWYAYQHPCPGADCMVRVLYEFDAGNVDQYLRVFRGTSAWFDNLSDTVDQASHDAVSGYFGGLDPADYCFYAYSGHEGEPFWYYLTVRDTIYVSEGNEEHGTWDWNADQAYRICIEKVAEGCHPPCELYDDGCGTPVQDK